jgi:hypothetical protein
MKPKIIWPGMSKERLRAALYIVASYAAENSCTCDRTGSPPQQHRGGCWVRGIAADLRIVHYLKESI